MSSIGPSTSFPSGNLIVDEVIIPPSYSQSDPNITLHKRHPVPLDLEQTMANRTQDNTMTENRNNDMSINPTDNLRKVICTLDVRRFKLNELMVRIENGFIVIRGNQKEKRDKYGLVSRRFTRRLIIKRNLINDEIIPYFYSNGKLTITAKKRIGTFEIPIHRIHEPALAKHMYQPSFRQELNCPKSVMFNTGFLALLDYLLTLT